MSAEALRLLSAAGDAAGVARLLGGTSNPSLLVNATVESGETALLAAAARGHADVVGLLIRARAEPNRNTNGTNPLAAAAAGGYSKACKVLLTMKADVDASEVLVPLNARASSSASWPRLIIFPSPPYCRRTGGLR